MKEYFLLQFKLHNRQLKKTGVNPAIGYVFALVLFIGFSEYLYLKTEFAGYLLILASLSFMFKLSGKNRMDFLLMTFGAYKAKSIRFIENIIFSLPFTVMLISKGSFPEATVMNALVILSAMYTHRVSINITIPTPFYKHPNEFTVGFRNSFYVFPIAYILAAIAIGIENLNLGIFAMLLIFLTSLNYYTKPENEYFVWVYSCTPKTFLFKKLKLASKNILLVNLPVVTGLLIFYPEEFSTILLFYLAGLIFLWAIILAKYSAYPEEMNLPEGILLTFCIFFPPLLLALIPYFYSKSINSLKMYLND